MAAQYRAGIIACGTIALGHLRAYRQIPGVEVVAGADVSAEVRERWSKEHEVPRMYASAQELLEHESLDLVSICTWPRLRPQMTELACAAKVKGIVAEKPMAIDLAGCDQMIAAAEQSGSILIVGTQRRFHNRYIKARELIDAGAIGEVVQVTVFNPTGDLLTSSVHMVDVMRYVLHDADAEWVIGQIDRRDPRFSNAPLGLQQWEETHQRYGHHVETGAIGLVHFRGGARGMIEVGIVTRTRPSYSATIYGTEGFIEASGDRLQEGEPWLRARVKGQDGWIYPEIEPNNALQAEIQALIEVIEQGGTHPLDGRSARKGMEIVMAIYESARQRARIDLPLSTLANPLEEMIAEGVV